MLVERYVASSRFTNQRKKIHVSIEKETFGKVRGEKM